MIRFTSVLLLVLLFPLTGLSQKNALVGVTEYQIKAAFLFNFAKFVDWPEEDSAQVSDPITIGILGEDPFGNDLDQTVAGKSVKGRKFVVRRFRTLDALESCHILFISRSEKKNMPQIVTKIKNWGVLTVGEAEWFAEQGGIINLVSRNNKVRFQINLEACHRAGLKMSSRLLRLAEIIGDRYANGTKGL